MESSDGEALGHEDVITVGPADGIDDGDDDALALGIIDDDVGFSDGESLGDEVGIKDGPADGIDDGVLLGLREDILDGLREGLFDGLFDGLEVFR